MGTVLLPGMDVKWKAYIFIYVFKFCIIADFLSSSGRAVMIKYSNSGGPDPCDILIILKVFSDLDRSLILCKIINHIFIN